MIEKRHLFIMTDILYALFINFDDVILIYIFKKDMFMLNRPFFTPDKK